MTIRIRHQSLTDLTQLPRYGRMLEEHARRMCGVDTVVDLHGLRPGTYPGGMTPVEMTRYRAFAGSPGLVQRFSRQAARMVASGADVIIPAEGVVKTVLVRNSLREVEGTPVLDSYGALLAFAEMLVQLRRRSGLATGRRGAYARPSEPLVRHLRKITTEVLRDAQTLMNT